MLIAVGGVLFVRPNLVLNDLLIWERKILILNSIPKHEENLDELILLKRIFSFDSCFFVFLVFFFSFEKLK